MPKNQVITPTESRAKSQLKFEPIPVNQYDRTLKEELINFSPKDLLRIQRDMEIIRAFENMLNEVKLRGSYNGVEYNHRGPAHLSIGQEATAVGQAYLLGVDDHIYAHGFTIVRFKNDGSAEASYYQDIDYARPMFVETL